MGTGESYITMKMEKRQANKYASLKVQMCYIGAEDFVVVKKFL